MFKNFPTKYNTIKWDVLVVFEVDLKVINIAVSISWVKTVSIYARKSPA